jgi:hypothetical protein
MRVWNVWTWLKNMSGFMETPYEEVVNKVTIESHISHKRLQRHAGDENGLSCSVVARSAKDASDSFVGHAVISGNLTQGFVVFNDTSYHVRPFFRWDAMVRLTWTRMLL